MKFEKVELISICGTSILVEEKSGNEFVLEIGDYRTRDQLRENIDKALEEKYRNE